MTLRAGRARKAPEFLSGVITESTFLDVARQYLGKGYREAEPGRFVSADGLRQVRFGAHETRESELHAHFEAYDGPAGSGGKVTETATVQIVPDRGK